MKIHYIIFALLFFTTNIYSQDIKEWRGINRDGIYEEPELLKEWPIDGPELIWSVSDLPVGHSSMCIVENTIYITGNIDSMDICIALEIDGEIKWKTEYGRSWNGSFPTARCTPTYDNGKLYLSSGYGDIACIDASSGELQWQVKGYEEWDINFCKWGFSESLIVTEDKVICNPIGSKTTTVAINKNNGEIMWKSISLKDSAAYVSPILIKYAEKDMLINVSSSYIYGVDLKDGNILWTFRYYDVNTPTWHYRAPIINCNSPIYNNDQIYVTSGYNHTGVMLNLNETGSKVELAWADTVLDTHHGGVVKSGNYIYGSNWINNGTGNWVCIDWRTGEKKWEEKWKSKGSIISVNDKLILYDEKMGFVGLVEATPEQFNLISSFKIPLGRGPYWSHPVIHNGILYVRHSDVLMAYRINKL